MRLIKGNILGVLQDEKDGNVVKKGSLFLMGTSDTIRFNTILVEDVDKDRVKNIKKGDTVHIHKGSGHYLNDKQLIFNQGHIIYAD